ncbi:unnamed protein product [Owenia fusiformis]|uniref:G-protein coupled receptor Mth2 n=1 Tax=Owenia fusiformis TaxID=6347 RepID=A0A8S4PWD0_OWEFU|nr:unnamed protein product [Owenia fusiformis]
MESKIEVLITLFLLIRLCAQVAEANVNTESESNGDINITAVAATDNPTTTFAADDERSMENVSGNDDERPLMEEEKHFDYGDFLDFIIILSNETTTVMSPSKAETTQIAIHLDPILLEYEFDDMGPCDAEFDLELLQFMTPNCSMEEPSMYSCMNRCGEKTQIPDAPLCSCDIYCQSNRDCCLDYNSACPADAKVAKQIQENMTTKNITFDCIDIDYDKTSSDFRQIINTCPNMDTCVNADDGIMNLIPVNDNSSDVHYINRYCAICNNVSVENIIPWPSDVECEVEEELVQSIDDLMKYIDEGRCRIKLTAQARRCYSLVTDECSEDCGSDALKAMCYNSPRQIVSNHDTNFKNEFCAFCNDIPTDHFMCSLIYFSINGGGTSNGLKKFSFSLLLDIDPNKGTKIGFNVNGESLTYNCEKNGYCDNVCERGYEYRNEKCVQVYSRDTFTAKWIYSFSQPYTQALASDISFIDAFQSFVGRPLNRANLTHVVHYDGESLNCTLTAVFLIKKPVNQTALEHNTPFYEVFDAFNEIYNTYFFDSDTLKLCVESYDNVTCFDMIQQNFVNDDTVDAALGEVIEESDTLGSNSLLADSADTMGLVTIICLSISIICMITRLILQIFVPVFHTLSGKMQFSLVLALCLASSLYLVGPMLVGMMEACKTVGVLIHYFYLVTFAWMVIIALDMYLAFRSTLQAAYKGFKRFVVYSLIAWVSPGAIVGVSVALDNADIPSSYKPMYGDPVCLISNTYANLVFFAGPLALMIVFNIVFYSLTVWKLRQTWQQTAKVKSGSENHLDVYIKLFIIMGFTWILGFVAPFVGSDFVWYVFILLNALQGAFIFVASVCTKRVLKSLKCLKQLTRNPTSSSIIRTTSTTKNQSTTKF